MPLPTELLQNIADEAGGRVVLVVGAGCSKENPTNLELAGELAERMHETLLNDHVLDEGDCEDPSDLSLLADAVFEKTGGQTALVERFPLSAMRLASPNEGHFLAAALLIEGCVGHILTLNFDLAMSSALTMLGAPATVSVVAGPSDFGQIGTQNLVYLHRNVDAPFEDWILRTEILDQAWVAGWEELLATKLLVAPVTVFVGLGSPARVLTDTVERITKAVPEGSHTFVVDSLGADGSTFADAIGGSPDSIFALTWTEFMNALSERVLAGQRERLERTFDELVASSDLAESLDSAVCARLFQLGLVRLGQLRSAWLLDTRPFAAEGSDDHRLWLADLLVAIGFAEEQSNSEAVFFDDGVIEFRRENEILSSVIVAHGRGHRGWVALESHLAVKAKRLVHDPAPSVVLVAGVNGEHRPHVSTPDSIVSNESGDLVVARQERIVMVAANEVRTEPDNYLRILVGDE